jgi:hypothetical protein
MSNMTLEDSDKGKAPEDLKEDDAYSGQFFTISRRGHTTATAEFGSPTLVWHVAFWPKRKMDPFSIAMTDDDGKNKRIDDIIAEFRDARDNVVRDFSHFLKRLQDRGRHPASNKKEQPFTLRGPRDWDAKTTPFRVFDSEAIGFTLWWPDSAKSDDPPDAGPGPADAEAGNPTDAKPDNPSKNPMSVRPEKQPIRTDLRVRVLAEANIDFSMVTFFIDAGKPWNEDPIYLSGDIPNAIGKRRRDIFGYVKNIKTISEARLEAVDHEGKRLIDLDLLPEPDPICGTTAVELEKLTGCAEGFTEAKALKAAADYLYEGVWKEFCEAFGFTVNSIAGDTDVVFANFRGLVMSTCGTKLEIPHKLVRDPEPKELSETAHPGSTTFPRFDGGGEGYASDKIEPNAVVKAYMPFMRRFRADGDWRDWIACGIFDWRAIYINAVGAKSEFAPFDEWNYDVKRKLPDAISAGHIPQRRVKEASNPDGAAESNRDGGPEAPTTDMNDRPAPFRFLLLTKFEPNRKQIGRMVERVNSLGTRRLFALKDWSVIQNASVWISHYGRQLDDAFGEWIRNTDELQGYRSREIKELDGKFWNSIQLALEAVASAKEIDAPAKEEVEQIRLRYRRNPRLACHALRKHAEKELRKLSENDQQQALWKLVQDSGETKPLPWDLLLAAVDDWEEEYREKAGERDTSLGEINREAGQALIEIAQGLDTLGDGAVGGLPYRIARSSYYAKSFDDAQMYLRVGNIETWWSYEQFAKRGMEPDLRFIASVGERLEKLRSRLQIMKQDILQRSIALQTEATRDNTHRLEQIQRGIRRMGYEIHILNKNILGLKRDAAEHEKVAAIHNVDKAFWLKLTAIAGFIAAIVGWAVAAYHSSFIAEIVGWGAAAYNSVFK